MSARTEGPKSLDVLAISPHPDDVELACGGTLALLAAAGRRVGILHLTAGEAGTRGTPEQRRAEAERAGRELGVERVDFLDCGDRFAVRYIVGDMPACDIIYVRDGQIAKVFSYYHYGEKPVL